MPAQPTIGAPALPALPALPVLLTRPNPNQARRERPQLHRVRPPLQLAIALPLRPSSSSLLSPGLLAIAIAITQRLSARVSKPAAWS